MERKYILWDPRDGDPRRADNGAFISDGIIGRVTLDNVYIGVYAQWPDGAPSVQSLEVGQCIKGVRYGLSGSSGSYDVYRVQ